MEKQNKINLNHSQLVRLNKLWFIYGNWGTKHTHENHRYIQNLIEHNEDTELFYSNCSKGNLTKECVSECKLILNNP